LPRCHRRIWRAGIDPNPLDVTGPDNVAWLEALSWPEHEHRRQRLRAAALIAAADPPLLVVRRRADDLPSLATRAPQGATLVGSTAPRSTRCRRRGSRRSSTRS
jgi:hypothetical protein